MDKKKFAKSAVRNKQYKNRSMMVVIRKKSVPEVVRRKSFLSEATEAMLKNTQNPKEIPQNKEKL